MPWRSSRNCGARYSAVDIVVTVFRVVKASDKMPEHTKLEFVKVRPYAISCPDGYTERCITRRQVLPGFAPASLI